MFYLVLFEKSRIRDVTTIVAWISDRSYKLSAIKHKFPPKSIYIFKLNASYERMKKVTGNEEDILTFLCHRRETVMPSGDNDCGCGGAIVICGFGLGYNSGSDNDRNVKLVTERN